MENHTSNLGRKIINFPGKARSLVWNYFGFYADEHGGIIKSKAVCRICHKTYSYAGNTTNLFSHLDNDHRDVYEKLRSPCNSQVTLPELQQDVSFQKDSSTFKALQKCIITSSLPLNIVENDNFISFIKVLDPMFELPKPQMLLTSINDEYDKLKEHVKTELGLCTNSVISVSQQTGYLNIKCHYIVEHDNRLVKKVHTLQTSENNAELEPLDIDTILNILKSEWSLHNVEIVAVSKEVVLQSSSTSCGYKNVGCFGHVIHNIVNNLLRDEMISKIVSKGLNLHKVLFALPTLLSGKDKMQRYFDDKFCQPLTKDITQWDMLRHILIFHLENVSTYSQLETQLQEQLFTRTDKFILNIIFDILDAFERAAGLVSNSAKPTLSLVLPTLKKLDNLLKAKANPSTASSDQTSIKLDKVRSSMIEMLDKSIAADLSTYRLGSILDPRTKALPFLSSSERDQVKAKLIDECHRVTEHPSGSNGSIPENALTTINEHQKEDKIGSITLIQNIKQEICDEDLQILSLSSNMEGATEPKKARLVEENNWLDDIMNVDNNGPGCEDPVLIEVERYMAEPAMNLTDDPLDWWSIREHIYPSVAKVMRQYLAIPASSMDLKQILKLEAFKGIKVEDNKYNIDREKLNFLMDNMSFT